MDFDLYTVEREVYTLLDWLGDVGGLNEGLVMIGSLFMFFLAGNGLDFLLYSHMFKIEGNIVIPKDMVKENPNNAKLIKITNRKPLDSTYKMPMCNLLFGNCKMDKVNRKRLEKA